jgi:hypothetical protein
MSSTGHQGKIAIIRHWKNSLGNLNGIHWQGPIDLSSSGSDYYCIIVKQPEKSENQGRNSNVFIAVVAIPDREDLFAGG